MKLRVTFALFACVALFTTFARAQMSDNEKKAAARAAYTEGVDLQDRGKPADALGRFEAAQKLFDAPTHLLHIAECQALTGKLVEASETYETLSRKTLPAGSPDAFVQAQEQGKAELTALRQRIPTMRVTIKPEPQTLQNLQINVNDKQMPAELVGIARPVNPGPYRLTATATGWGTTTPSDVEVKEKDAKSVELTLTQGATGGAVVVGPANPNNNTAGTTTPQPYEQSKPKPVQSPSAAGLLLGARAGFFVPGGDVDKTIKFENFATAGPGLGLDVIGRVARLFLIGGTLEFASLGAPAPRAFPAGFRAEVGTRTYYVGVLAGIMPNVDKVTFVADAGAGFRILDRNLMLTDINTSAQTKYSDTFSGLELAINAGVSIPAGPLRIIPKAGVALGQFTNRDCSLPTAATTPSTSSLNCSTTSGPGTATITASSHTMFNVVVGVYYHVDFSKKAGAAKGPAILTNTAAM